MRDITDLTVTQYRFFSAGTIPYRTLRVASRLQPLLAPFAFSSAMVDPTSDEIVLESGTFESLVIERVHITDRRIVVRVLGSSQAADGFHRVLESALMKASSDEIPAPLKPVLFFQETSCTVTLAVDAMSFLAPPVVRLLGKDLLVSTSSEVAQTAISHLQLKVELAYKPKSDQLDKHKIGLAPKQFVLEPLANTPLSERRFYTSSPTDSDTHARLIEAFERALS
jgi:hypothetical protein